MTSPALEVLFDPSIDAQLGAASDRYFGAGYTEVQHTFTKFSKYETTADCIVQIDYPVSWSRKKGHNQEAHLSSIDALLLSVRLLELWLLEDHVTSRSVERSWLRRCELRPGRAPVAVSAPIHAHIDVGHAEEDGTTILTGRITLDSFCVILEAVLADSTDDATKDTGHLPSYLAESFKRMPVAMGRVEWDATSSTVCPFVLSELPDSAVTGLESGLPRCVTFLESTLIAAQVGQVMLYDLDRVNRAESETMWLRRATFSRVETPAIQAANGEARVELRSSKLLARERASWRVIELQAQVLDVDVQYSLVHELPMPRSQSGE